MNVKSFTNELLVALAETGRFEKVASRAEGPIANGYAYLDDEFFLRFYFNEVTGTMAFALIENQQRVWGVDYDNRRGWHIHPVDNPAAHVDTLPLSILEVVAYLEEVLAARE